MIGRQDPDTTIRTATRIGALIILALIAGTIGACIIWPG